MVFRMETEFSREAEEYIETIYRLQKRNGTAKTKELAEILHVVPGSITNTVEHLESHGLVIHEPYRGVKLTKQGEKLALNVLRRHRLAERLLTDVLKAEWSSVHEDACILEHALTKNVADLLEKRLGHPKVCPHGNPIPTENGLIEEQNNINLTETTPNESYIVESITDEEQKDLTILAEKKIIPNTIIQVTNQDAHSIFLVVEGKKQSLNKNLAASVKVRKNEEPKHAI
jgi:DtxR family transcriptional regulator, Mn-dependent transcriptional regulator